MALRFNIENESSLPDGGPVSFTVTGKRTVDIGRDRHLDWTLPDPARLISGKHCEVHYRDGGYWLHDVSTNGTFLNGADQRMRGPHKLRSGDRFIVGHFIIGVSLDAIEGEAVDSRAANAASATPRPADYAELWNVDGDVAPPVDRQQLRTPREAARPVNPEFLDWAASVPEPDTGRARRSPFRAKDDRHEADMSWASGVRPAAPVAEPPPAVPSPRRPVWTDEESSWTDKRRGGPGRIAPEQAFSEQPSSQQRWREPSAGMVEPLPTPPEKAPSRIFSRDDGALPSNAASPDAGHAEASEFSRQLAKTIGLPENFFANKDAAELGEQVGAILHITVGSLMELLQARNQAKQMARSANQTTVQAVENNPLKFSPTPEDAMRILFGPPTQSYLDARAAFAQAFGDLKSHQLKTYVAMQQAVVQLVASLDPTSLAREIEGGRSSWFGSGKSKLWDAFLVRWTSLLGNDSSAPVDAFMRHFAEFYDRGGRAGGK
jgi:type VI secretion system protein ImpI